MHYMYEPSSGKGGSGGPSNCGSAPNAEWRTSAHEKQDVAPRTSRGAGKVERI